MKAMRISEFNKNAKLQMGDVQIPEVRSLDVLAEIHAASVNPLDIKIRNGLRAGYPLSLIHIYTQPVSGLGPASVSRRQYPSTESHSQNIQTPLQAPQRRTQ